MRDIQAWQAVEAVARRVGVDIDPLTRAEAVRRHQLDPDSALSPREALRAAGSALGITFLERTLERADLEQVLRDEALPIVVCGGPVVRVLHGRDGGDLFVTAIAADGSTQAEVVTLEALLDGAGKVLAEIPVNVTPTVSEAAEHGLDHAHPSPGRRLLKLLVREKRDLGLVYFYATLTGLFSLALPLGVQAIVQLISGRMIVQTSVIVLTVFVILGTLVAGVLQLLQLQVVETMQQRVFARIALELGFRVPRLRLESLLGEDLPEQMNRFFDVINIQKSLSKLLTETTTALLQVIFGLILLTFYHPYFTLFGIFMIVCLYLIFRWTGPRGLETSLKESKFKYRVVHWLEEMARNIGTFKLAGSTTLPVQRTDVEVAGYLKYRNKHFQVLMLQGASIVVFKTVITGGLLVLGAVLVAENQINLGQFVASELVIITVLAGIEKIIVSLSTVYDILTAVEKVGHVTDLALDEHNGVVPPELTSGRGVELEAKNLAYTYAGAARPALAGLSFRIDAGSVVAFAGLEGSGQTTLLQVLAGLLRDYDGALSLNGVSLRDIDVDAFRARLGASFTTPELFEGTVAENIAVGRPHVRTEDILWATEQVGLRHELQNLRDGLETRIAAGGRQLPMHVARKITLARALAGRPKLLVFDEVFAPLEPAFRREMIRFVTNPQAEWTVVASSHDPAFLAACDWIFLLDAGTVVAEGSFDDLLAHPRFRDIITPALERRMEGV